MEIEIIETHGDYSEHMNEVNESISIAKEDESLEALDVETHINIKDDEYKCMHYISVIKFKEA